MFNRSVPEFQRGDVVTFRAYHDQRIEAKVLEVKSAGSGGFFQSNVPTYRLEGLSKPLLSETTGKSIMESQLFEEPPKKFKW